MPESTYGGAGWSPGVADQVRSGSDPAAGRATTPATGASGAWVWLGLVAVVAVALSVSLNEDGDNGWGRSLVWSGFAVVAAVAVLTPLVRGQLDVRRAWIAAAIGAGSLVAYWVLLVLPRIDMNVSFLATLGTAAAVGAVWLAPGRPTNVTLPESW